MHAPAAMEWRRPSHLAAACLLLRWGTAGAWSPDGHERIHRIAQGLLVGKHRDQIRTLMHSDVIDVAPWEQTMTKKYPETDVLHWHHQDPEWTCGGEGGLGDKGGHVRCDGKGAESGSLFCALAYFFEHFAHDALLNEFPRPKEPINTPRSLPILDKIPASELKPSHFLRWLVILVGDLHQPMHWLRGEYSYGANVIVRYKGEERTLLKFWEEYIPKELGAFIKEGMHPDITDAEYGTRSRTWEHKLPTELFRDWAKETAEKLCTEVYGPMTVNVEGGPRIQSPFELTDELVKKWMTMAKDLMTLGGERLAFVLNEIVEHKRHKEADGQGRGLPSRKIAVGTKIGPGTGDAASDFKDLGLLYRQLEIEERRRSMSNLAWNAGVAVIVVPSLLLALRWHESQGVHIRIRQHMKY